MEFAEEDLQLIAKGVQKYINEGQSQNVISNLMNFTPEPPFRLGMSQFHFVLT
jgi:hypothetical protein